MNNKALNKEFSKMIKKRNKTGFTDSEEEDDSSRSLKSPKSGRSSHSGRSLLSARSPRDDKIAQFKKTDSRKYSPEKSDNEIEMSRNNRFTKGKSLSPKSPRNLEDSPLKYPRINQSRSQSRDDDESYGRKPITPRSPHSTLSEKDDFEGMDMMRTMRRPMKNDALTKTMKRNEEFDDYENRKSRIATPTKMENRYQRMESGLNAKTNFMQRKALHTLENDLDEEEFTRSGKTTPSRSESRHVNYNDDDSPKHSKSESPKYVRGKSESPKTPSRNRSPVADSLDVDESLKKDYDKHVNTFNYLMNPKMQNRSESSESKQEVQQRKTSVGSVKSEKDPQVEETIEDKRITEKLQKEREQKRIMRENRTKNMTDTTRKIEDAIEKVENTMEDSLRLNNLKEISNELKYSTKPTLEDILKNERISRSKSKTERDHSRTRSLSSSSRLDRPLSGKYANVKPKTQTRLQIQSARNASDLNSSKQDIMNDSASLRENIYSEWYIKKMEDARLKLKEAKLRQKDEEEKKAQELIEKLQKSKLIFRMWNEKKEESLKEKQKGVSVKTEKEIKDEKIEKKKEAEIAFREWLKKKKEFEREKKEEDMEKERKLQKEKRKDNRDKKPPRPPVSYDSWAKRKEEEIKEKLNAKKEEERQKQLEEKEKRKKKELAKKSFYEWLDKKEEDDFSRSRSLSTSMSSLPPFYPTSRIIPFGR